MAKRFIDTGLFDDAWFMNLSVGAKLLWVYLITKCNHAGIIEINKKLIEFQTKIKSIDTVIKELSNRLVTVKKDPLILFIPKYIYFQYPNFPQSKVRQQDSAVQILIKYGLFDEEKHTVSKELTNSYDNDCVTDTVIVEKKEVTKVFNKPIQKEVEDYFFENGYSRQAGTKAFNYYSVADWKDSTGKPVRNWKQKMQAVWFKEENNGQSKREKSDPTVAIRNGGYGFDD